MQFAASHFVVVSHVGRKLQTQAHLERHYEAALALLAGNFRLGGDVNSYAQGLQLLVKDLECTDCWAEERTHLSSSTCPMQSSLPGKSSDNSKSSAMGI